MRIITKYESAQTDKQLALLQESERLKYEIFTQVY